MIHIVLFVFTWDFIMIHISLFGLIMIQMVFDYDSHSFLQFLITIHMGLMTIRIGLFGLLMIHMEYTSDLHRFCLLYYDSHGV